MNNDKLPPGINIKQRIVGAVVLVALTVIITPLLLDMRKDYDNVIGGSNIPPKPDDFRVEVLEFDKDTEIEVPTMPVENVDVTADSHAMQPGDKVVADDTVQEEPSAKQRFSELRNRINDSEDGSVAKAGQATAEAWVVQLASLTRKQNAIILRDRVQKNGQHAFVVSSDVDGQAMYRVLVGPYLLRSQAEEERQLLQKEIKLNGLVHKYRR